MSRGWRWKGLSPCTGVSLISLHLDAEPEHHRMFLLLSAGCDVSLDRMLRAEQRGGDPLLKISAKKEMKL